MWTVFNCSVCLGMQRPPACFYKHGNEPSASITNVGQLYGYQLVQINFGPRSYLVNYCHQNS
jgi:hypothetical protein